MGLETSFFGVGCAVLGGQIDGDGEFFDGGMGGGVGDPAIHVGFAVGLAQGDGFFRAIGHQRRLQAEVVALGRDQIGMLAGRG